MAQQHQRFVQEHEELIHMRQQIHSILHVYRQVHQYIAFECVSISVWFKHYHSSISYKQFCSSTARYNALITCSQSHGCSNGRCTWNTQSMYCSTCTCSLPRLQWQYLRDIDTNTIVVAASRDPTIRSARTRPWTNGSTHTASPISA